MTEIPRETWLFTRGSDSVRLVREERPQGCLLFVYGPGTKTITHGFANVADCMKRQAEIEQNLLGEGYRFAGTVSDRRSSPGQRSGADHHVNS